VHLQNYSSPVVHLAEKPALLYIISWLKVVFDWTLAKWSLADWRTHPNHLIDNVCVWNNISLLKERINRTINTILTPIIMQLFIPEAGFISPLWETENMMTL
jgi:hypothetical protein